MNPLVSETEVQTTAAVEPQPAEQAQPGLFRTVWRWHFYAGLFASPFLITLAVTGMLYIFSPEIGFYLHRDLVYVSPEGTRLPPSALLAAATTYAGQGEATELMALPEADRSVVVTVSDEEAKQKREIFLNPYDASVLGELDPKQDGVRNFFKVVLDIHRRLFIGTTGRVIIELVTCWGLLLFCTGLYLWWPRRREKVKGVWVPRLKGKSYMVLRDLHALGGVYLLPVLFLIVGTGMFYTVLWGRGAMAVSVVSHQGLEGLSAMAGGRGKQKSEEEKPAPPTEAQIDAVWEYASRTYPDRSLELVLGKSSAEKINVRAMNGHSTGTYGSYKYDNLMVDPAQTTLISNERLADHPAFWMHGWTYPLHVGSIGGPATKVIWFLACVVLAALPVTGLWMWWKRRPTGKSGFPRRREHRLPLWLTGAVILCCLFFPLAGISVVLALLVDLVWFRWIRNRSETPQSGSAA